jgi:hypothetical protein
VAICLSDLARTRKSATHSREQESLDSRQPWRLRRFGRADIDSKDIRIAVFPGLRLFPRLRIEPLQITAANYQCSTKHHCQHRRIVGEQKQ